MASKGFLSCHILASGLEYSTAFIDSYLPRLALGSILIFGGAALAVTIVGSIIAGAFMFFNYSSSTPPEVAKEITKNEMSSENVDTFVRTYVSNLLDFSPRSYQYSQIQAMAVMKPELMKKYWNETSFPLSRKQLSRLPQNQSVMIDHRLASDGSAGSNRARPGHRPGAEPVAP